MTDTEREQIEQELESKLGFRWTPQMRHGHKALKLWNALVDAMGKIERLRASLRNRSLAVRAAQGINLHRPLYTGMSPNEGVEATADAIHAVYQEAAEVDHAAAQAQGEAALRAAGWKRCQPEAAQAKGGG